MEKIKAKELVNIMAGKLNLEVDCNNFDEFRKFIDDIYSQFVTKWQNIDDQAYYWHNVNVPERIIELPNKVLKEVYADADKQFGLVDGDADFFDPDDESFDCYKSPFEINGERSIVNYVDTLGKTIVDFLQYWEEVSKKSDCKMIVETATDDDCAYCNHQLKWELTANGLKSLDSFFEIPDDNERELMDALYWLTETFAGVSFEEFDKLGVELRYYQKETQDWE